MSDQLHIESEVPAVAFACARSAWRAWGALVGQGLRVHGDVRVVEMPCSGRVDEVLILRSIEQGARGVLVLGCPIGGCRYLDGSARARKRSERAAASLAELPGCDAVVEFVALSGTSPEEFLSTIREFLRRVNGEPKEKAVES